MSMVVPCGLAQKLASHHRDSRDEASQVGCLDVLSVENGVGNRTYSGLLDVHRCILEGLLTDEAICRRLSSIPVPKQFPAPWKLRPHAPQRVPRLSRVVSVGQ